MLEVIQKVVQHHPDGNVSVLGQTGGFQIPEQKLAQPSSIDGASRQLAQMMRSVAGKPELDENLLVDNISTVQAKYLLELIANGQASIASAQIVGEHVKLHITLSTETLNNVRDKS